MPEPSETDWAYAAGFVDGEGCIAVSRSFTEAKARFHYSVQIVLANRDRSVLDWMQATWGGWVVAVAPGSRRGQACWNWRCPTGFNAKPFLNGIRPWLKIKMAQCDNALLMIDLLQRGRRTLGRAPLPQAWLGAAGTTSPLLSTVRSEPSAVANQTVWIAVSRAWAALRASASHVKTAPWSSGYFALVAAAAMTSRVRATWSWRANIKPALSSIPSDSHSTFPTAGS